jgi:hypothetical protein
MQIIGCDVHSVFSVWKYLNLIFGFLKRHPEGPRFTSGPRDVARIG